MMNRKQFAAALAALNVVAPMSAAHAQALIERAQELVAVAPTKKAANEAYDARDRFVRAWEFLKGTEVA
jgi:hypothetical protein